MNTKRCYKCNIEKPISEFHKNKLAKDGLQSYCKSCSTKLMAEYRATETGKLVFHKMNTSEKGHAKYARYRKTEKYKNGHRLHATKYKKSHPEVIKAHQAVAKAIKDRVIPKAADFKCSRCDKQAKHYHHYLGYDPKHWLDVIPLCLQCHVAENSIQI